MRRLVVPVLFAIGAGGAAHAGTASTSMAISATVLAQCSIMATPLSFGAYDGQQLDAASSVEATCSNGAGYDIAVDSGIGSGATISQRQLTGVGENVHAPLSYAIYADTARNNLWGSTTGVDTVAGIGSGTAQAIPVYGRIPANQSPGDGSFSDTVQVSITF